MGSDLLASLTSRLPILALILQWPSLDHDFSAVIKNHILLGLREFSRTSQSREQAFTALRDVWADLSYREEVGAEAGI